MVQGGMLNTQRSDEREVIEEVAKIIHEELWVKARLAENMPGGAGLKYDLEKKLAKKILRHLQYFGEEANHA